ncbi:MAG: hypothetical protein EZS28_020075, partial [Streblomastix strix]
AGPQFSKAIQKLNELSEHDKYIFTFSDQPQVLVSQSGICDVLPITEQSQNNSSTLEDLISPLNANNTELTDKVQLSLSQTLDIKGLPSPKTPRSIKSPNQIDQSIFGEHQLDEISEDESELGQAVAALKIERELRLSLEGKNQEIQQELNKLRIYHNEIVKETQHLRENYLIEHLEKVKIQTEAKQAQARSKQQLIVAWNRGINTRRDNFIGQVEFARTSRSYTEALSPRIQQKDQSSGIDPKLNKNERTKSLSPTKQYNYQNYASPSTQKKITSLRLDLLNLDDQIKSAANDSDLKQKNQKSFLNTRSTSQKPMPQKNYSAISPFYSHKLDEYHALSPRTQLTSKVPQLKSYRQLQQERELFKLMREFQLQSAQSPPSKKYIKAQEKEIEIQKELDELNNLQDINKKDDDVDIGDNKDQEVNENLKQDDNEKDKENNKSTLNKGQNTVSDQQQQQQQKRNKSQQMTWKEVQLQQFEEFQERQNDLLKKLNAIEKKKGKNTPLENVQDNQIQEIQEYQEEIKEKEFVQEIQKQSKKEIIQSLIDAGEVVSMVDWVEITKKLANLILDSEQAVAATQKMFIHISHLNKSFHTIYSLGNDLEEVQNKENNKQRINQIIIKYKEIIKQALSGQKQGSPKKK